MMADCSDISLMLGPFEDRELEPHEYQEVAFHLARCDKCTAELADYATMGRELRTIVGQLPLDGFKEAVMRRIENLPVPLSLRLARIFGGIGDLFPSGLGMAVAGAVAAAITVVLVTPVAQMAMRGSDPAREFASAERVVRAVPVAGVETAPRAIAHDVADVEEEPHAIISKLESDIPSVAVWNEPQMATTVIWLPDQ
jgi:anti-sigma factor RsiW